MTSRLTAEQSEAIHFPARSDSAKHLVIEAGAGAGKTFVLTERIARLLSNQKDKIDASQLYVVSFSKAAAAELQERVRRKLSETLSPIVADQVHISTIDSLFSKLLESKFPAWWDKAFSHAQTSGVLSRPDPQLVNESVVFDRLQRRLSRLLDEIVVTKEDEGAVLDFLVAGGFRSNQNREGARVEILRALLSEGFLNPHSKRIVFATKSIHPASRPLLQKLLTLARNEFFERLRCGELTHTDRTLFLYSLFCVDGKLQTGTPFFSETTAEFPIAPLELIVDEYQDTNEIQHDILFSLVARGKGRMVVVGDPKQSIYGFRNAHVGVFKRLTSDPLWKHIELKVNFRSEPALLEEINELSKCAFEFEDPDFPPEFVQSDFYAAAKQFHIGANPLVAGREAETAHERALVRVVSASLNKERIEAEVPFDKQWPLSKFQTWALAQELKELVAQKRVEWREVVVLCESNNRVRKIAKELSLFNVPTLAMTSGKKNFEATTALCNKVALTLFHLILGPVQPLAFFELLISPLVHLGLEDVALCLREFSAGKLGNSLEDILYVEKNQRRDPSAQYSLSERYPTVASLRTLILEARELALFEPFAAWQQLRWKCSELSTSPLARTFCARMDDFAHELSRGLDNRRTRRRISEIILNPSLLKSDGSPLPSHIEDWSLPSSVEEYSSDDSDAVKVMTVHAAKGLEWKLVVFWPNTTTHFTPDFALLLSAQEVFLKWLPSDLEGLSVLKRIWNPDFNLQDAVNVTTRSGTSQLWFADLQKQLERDFERQRVFYTAFTRARSMLLLAPPAARANAKKSLRDKIADSRVSDPNWLAKSKISSFEETILARYLDSLFTLRKPDGRGSKPTVLWDDEDMIALPHVKNRSTEFKEYGPNWYETFLKEAAQSSQTETDEDIELPTEIRDEHLGPHSEPKLSWKVPLVDDGKRTAAPKKSTSSEVLEASTAGIKYHAAQENVVVQERQRTPLSLLRRSSKAFFHEYEVWVPQDTPKLRSGTLAAPSRRILDFISVFTVAEFPKALRDIGVCCQVGKGEHMPLATWLDSLEPSAPLIVVVDFKTGSPMPEHTAQIADYLDISSKLSHSGWHHAQLGEGAQHFLFEQGNAHVLGLLCYDLKSDNLSDALALSRETLTAFHERFVLQFWST